MAEKETNSPKTPAKATVKVTAKPAAAAKPATTATPAPKTTAAVKPATPATPAPKTAAAVKPATPATPAPKTTAAVKPATLATTAPKTAVKPAAVPASKPVASKPAPAAGKPKVAAAEVAASEAKTEKVKKEKPAKAAKTKEGGGSAFKAKAAAIVRTDNFKIFAIIALALIMVLCLSLGLVFGFKNCSGTENLKGMDAILASDPLDPANINAYAQTTKVGYSSQTVGTVERVKPVAEIRDERDAFPIDTSVLSADAKRYPTYGYTLGSVIGAGDDRVAARQAIINEAAYLCAWGTAGANRYGEQTADKYTKMDKDGWLYQYKDGQWIHSLTWGQTEYVESNYRQLYKHSASVGLYFGDVSDSEPGIVKQVTLRPRGYNSYSVTGVYAPAGEVVKVQLSGADMNATGGITVHIGQALYNGQANNIWASKNQMQRMPLILTTLFINKNTAEYDEATDTWTGYVGSFVGGPVYIQNTNSEIKVNISGACAYRHFILGYTTPEEFAELSKSTVPYFDLEVWEYGVLHSGPLNYAKNFSYNDLYKAAVLWEKVSIVTTTNGAKQGIVFIYDPFVAAGAAVAFPGRSSVNCPTSWMSQSLNYSSLVTSGSWGNFHEYHHNFQNYGVGYTGEVTNNGLNLVSYSLFTNISSLRQIGSYGGAGLSGWNCYTSAPWALNRVNANAITDTNGLAVYATLMHNLGQDAFIQSRGATGAAYFNKYAANTHQDMTYYAGLVQSYANISPSALTATDYPLFVPVSSVYQTGRTYMYDGEKREIITMQPYVIPYGTSFTVDLNPYTVNSAGQYESGSVVIAKDFRYTIKGVKTDGINGTFVKSGEGAGFYTFTPNSEIRSGKIYVTLEITTADGAHEWNGHNLDDVDLVIEFQQSHEWNKSVLERTVYTYSAESAYTDAQTAFENNFAGSSSVQKVDHSNPTQNCNTDIWLYPDTEANRTAHPNDPDYYFVSNNRIDVVDGKLYFREDGKYRIYLRGRLNCALYFSIDGTDYKLGATIKKTASFADSDKFSAFASDNNTYFDVEFTEGKCKAFVNAGGGQTLEFAHSGDNWLYIKEVLIVQSSPAVSYIGVGFAQWTVPMYTTEVKYYVTVDGNKQYVDEATDGGVSKYTYTQGGTKYYVEQDGTRYYYDQDGEKKEAGKVGAVNVETIYKDSSGKVVSAEQASNVDPIEPTAASYATAYRQSYQFKKEFESDYFILRSYNYTYLGDPKNYSTWDEGVTLVDTDLVPAAAAATATYEVGNMFVEGQDTYFHSTGKNQGSNKYIILDMGQQITANSITFLGRTPNPASTAQQGLPRSFTLAISDDGENFEDAGTYTNPTGAAQKATVNLGKEIKFRYIKITVNSTHSNNGHLILSGIYFTYTFRLDGNGGNHFSPDDKMFTYKGNWQTESCNANFGHVYVGKDATMEFDFDGTRFGIIASKLYGRNYEVRIDGVAVQSEEVLVDEKDDYVIYIFPELEEGKHSVVIYCPDGDNIDSIVIW